MFVSTVSPFKVRLLIAIFVITLLIGGSSMITVSGQSETEKPLKVVMGYYPEWKAKAYPPSAVPAHKLTHILYAFGDVNGDGVCGLFGSADETRANLEGFKALKEKHPHLKVLISLGGWTGSAHFSDAALTPESRTKLVASCLDLWIRGVSTNPAGVIDGIDVDWEYPGAPGETSNYRREDKTNYVALMTEFREQLDAQGKQDGKKYLLSAAVSASRTTIRAGLDLPALAPLLDYFNLMTYDFQGSWSSLTSFHNGLYPVKSDPGDKHSNIDSTVQAYLQGGIPAQKLVVGVPFYGRGWGGVKPGESGDGLFQSFTGSLEASYREIVKTYETDATKKRHPEAYVPYLYNPQTGIFISYEDPESAQQKAEYTLKLNLGGIMFWELTQDDEQGSLLTTICETVRGKEACGQ